MATLFSEKFDRFLHRVWPHGKTGALIYPEGLRWADARIGRSETCRDMLMRCATSLSGGDVRPFLLEDDMAVLATIEWENKKVRQAGIQAIKADGGEIGAALRGEITVAFRYFRFDAGQEAGIMFTHPAPHVHYSEIEGPRYSLNGWQSDNAIIDFFEHVYLCCYHDLWLEWAKTVWIRHCGKRHEPKAEDRFAKIVAAFRDSEFSVLEKMSKDIAALKGALRDAKGHYPLRIDRRLTDALAYPIA